MNFSGASFLAVNIKFCMNEAIPVAQWSVVEELTLNLL